MPSTVLIVPCYDEEDRLDRAEFLRLARARPDLEILFVDDGSRDGTRELVQSMRAEEPRIALHALGRNVGKAEAVRQGMLVALERGAAVAGYADADLATPVDEILRLVRTLEERAAGVVLASRVRLLGTSIDRRPLRHVVGRVFATVASFVLRTAVYDTQCGAKLFRRCDALATALSRPFRSRWAFDVELLHRLLRGTDAVAPLPATALLEVPLHAWRDAPGSKLRPSAMLRAGFDLLAMWVRSRLERAPHRAAAADLLPPSVE